MIVVYFFFTLYRCMHWYGRWSKKKWVNGEGLVINFINFIACAVHTTEPKMKHLIQFVIPKIKALWEDVAYVLLYKIEEVEGIKAHPQNDVRSCCRRLLIDWLSTSHGDYPKTWSTLLKNLRTLEELAAAVDDIERKLQHPEVITDY